MNAHTRRLFLLYGACALPPLNGLYGASQEA